MARHAHPHTVIARDGEINYAACVLVILNDVRNR